MKRGVLIQAFLVVRAFSVPTGKTCQCLSVEDRSSIVSDINAALKSDSFIVKQGSFDFYDISSCATNPDNSCYMQNPASRYGNVYVPNSPFEKAHADGPSNQSLGWIDLSFFSIIFLMRLFSIVQGYRLEPNEVVVVYGCTPPESEYYAFTPYITHSKGRSDFDSEAKWRLIFGSLGDSVNHHRTKTLCGTPFNENSLFLMGGNQVTLDRVSLAVKTVLPQIPINVVPIPAGDKEWSLNMGVEDTSDLFQLLQRISYPHDRNEYDAYLKSSPYSVLRVTPSSQIRGKKLLYGAPNLISRGLPKSEKNLSDAVDFLLKRAIRIERAKRPDSNIIQDFFDDYSSTVAPLSMQGIDYGLGCYENKVPCFADNRDTSYLVTLPAFRFNDKKEKVFYVGVDDKVAGFAEYSSGSIYNLKKQVGIVDFNSFTYHGSADSYLKGTKYESISDHLFVYSFSYDCAGSAFCTDVPETGFPSLPQGQWAITMFRAYVSPTGVGPNSTALVFPKQFKLS